MIILLSSAVTVLTILCSVGFGRCLTKNIGVGINFFAFIIIVKKRINTRISGSSKAHKKTSNESMLEVAKIKV